MEEMGKIYIFFLLKHLPPLASDGGGFVQAQSWGMRKVREQAVLFWNYLQSKCNLQTPTLLQEQRKKNLQESTTPAEINS